MNDLINRMTAHIAVRSGLTCCYPPGATALWVGVMHYPWSLIAYQGHLFIHRDIVRLAGFSLNMLVNVMNMSHSGSTVTSHSGRVSATVYPRFGDPYFVLIAGSTEVGYLPEWFRVTPCKSIEEEIAVLSIWEDTSWIPSK